MYNNVSFIKVLCKIDPRLIYKLIDYHKRDRCIHIY